MKTVVLSTTEGEYVVVSEVVKEIKFLYELLRSMEIKIPLPIKIKVDNVGGILLANNSGASERTQHVDIRAHFVRSYVMDEVVTIDFVKLAENTSDIMMKISKGFILSQHNTSWYILFKIWRRQRRKSISRLMNRKDVRELYSELYVQ